jgi:hypothetical protein
MSQFNKYLEIVQEGKDYQYNEGSIFSIFEFGITDLIRKPNEAFILTEQFKKIEKSIEKDSRFNKIRNGVNDVIIYYFLINGYVPYKIYFTSVKPGNIRSTVNFIKDSEIARNLKNVETFDNTILENKYDIKYPENIYQLFSNNTKNKEHVKSISEEETKSENREKMLRRNEENKMDLA